MRKLFFILVICFAMPGCTTMKFNHQPEITETDWPAIGEQLTVFPGDEILIQGAIAKQKFLHLDQLINGACYDVPAGYYPMTGDDDARYYFSSSGSHGTVIKSFWCDPLNGLTAPKNKPDIVCVLTVVGTNVCYDAKYSVESMETDFGESFQQGLIYSGADNKRAKLTYIERSKGRVTFTNNIECDLGETDTVNYKGAKVKIIKADSQGITYVVLEKFLR